MKKIIALALSLMLLLGCVSALAETAEANTVTMLGAFSIKYDQLPAGFDLTVVEDTDMAYRALITSADPAKPIYKLTMEFSDEWDGINTLADATENDIAAVKADFYDVVELDADEIIFEDGKTGEGTPLLIAKAVDGSFAAVYTIYMSHEIEVDAIHLNDDPMTDAEIDAIVKFLTDVQFTPVEK